MGDADEGEGLVNGVEPAGQYAAVLWTTFLLLVTSIPSIILLNVCYELEEPFGDSIRDIPGLAYVRAAAETTLNMVAPHPAVKNMVQAVLHVDLQPLIAKAKALQR